MQLAYRRLPFLPTLPRRSAGSSWQHETTREEEEEEEEEEEDGMSVRPSVCRPSVRADGRPLRPHHRTYYFVAGIVRSGGQGLPGNAKM